MSRSINNFIDRKLSVALFKVFCDIKLNVFEFCTVGVIKQDMTTYALVNCNGHFLLLFSDMS